MIVRRILSILTALLTFFTGLFLPADRTEARQLVSGMTLEEKIGQMIMPAFRTWTDTGGNSADVTTLNSDIEGMIKKYGFGGVILFAENCKGTRQTVKLVYDMQNAAKKSSSGIPMLIGIDEEGGYITRLGTGTVTCGNMALGAINDSAETRKSAALIASELASMGINTDFAPDLDVNNNPSNPVIGIRSFSSDEGIVAASGMAYITGMHRYNVATAVKHFPGHGDTATDSHTGLPLIDKTYDELKKTELVPFEKGIEANTDIVMTAHIVYPQIEKGTYTSKSTGKKVNLPATLSKTIITGILRKDMGYDGVVTTDALEMGAIADNFGSTDAVVLAINAGVDILLMPVSVTGRAGIAKMDNYISAIIGAVKSGRISESRITESAERIVALKIRRSIMNANTSDFETMASRAAETVGSAAHHQSELATAQKAVTVVKNNGNTLPIKGNAAKNTVLFYPYPGEEISVEFGRRLLAVDGIKPKITSYCYRYADADDYTSQIKNASSVIIFTEAYSANYMNKNSSSGWQAVFADRVIEKAHAAGKKVTVVSLHLPYDIAKYTNADAVMLAYGAKDMSVIPDFEGETKAYGVNIPAAVTVIFGGAKPQGRLPVDVPALDPSYGFSDRILYPQGTGLDI